MTPSRKGPARIGAVLPAVLQQAAQRHGALFAIQRRWRRLVGKPLAEHTRPVSLRRGRLVVHADQPGDGFALNYERPRLLERLQRTTEGRVEEIVIRAGEPTQAHARHAVPH